MTLAEVAERWRSGMELLVPWYSIAALQAITYEGDLGASSSWYLFHSCWATTHPEPDDPDPEGL